MKHTKDIIVFSLFITCALTIICVYLCFRVSYLKKQVDIQHNNYVECFTKSIETKWELEQYHIMDNMIE